MQRAINNHLQLRKDDFFIPYVTLWLKDMATVDASEPTLTDDGRVLCHKLDSLVHVLAPFMRAQV